jgi:hypothetical protein
VLTVMLVKRDRYKAVSTQIPLLIPCLPGEAGEPATFLPDLPASRSIRVRSLSFEEAAKALHEKPRHEVAERRYYAGVVALLEAIQSGNREAQELAFQRLNFPPSHEGQDVVQTTVAEWLRNTPLSKIERFAAQEISDPARSLMLAAIRSLRSVGEPHRFFCWQVTRTLLERVRLVLWWDGERFLPALYCEDRTTAIYSRVLLKATRGQGLATCLKCGEWFVQDRANQDYCSIAHREAHRVARWRSHQKQLTTRKGSKHVTRKTR